MKTIDAQASHQQYMSPNARNYGIDLLRIVSMIMVAVLHVLGQGGILGSLKVMEGNYAAAWMMEIASFCAVNCFGLISGYVGYGKPHKGKSLFSLCAQSLFYSLGTTLVFLAVKPSSVGPIAPAKAFFPYLYSSVGGNLLVTYVSPTILCCAFALLMFFEGLQVDGRAAILVRMLSPLCFGSYLLHTEPLIWENLLKGRFAGLVTFSSPWMALSVLGAGVGIWACGSAVDWVRAWLFDRFHVGAACARLGKWLDLMLWPGVMGGELGQTSV